MTFNTRHHSRRNNNTQGRGRQFPPRRMPQRGAPKQINPALLVKKAVAHQVDTVYEAEHTFADFSLNALVLQNITSHGYTAPTPIQDQIIPHIMQGRDVIGIANTGTGKTAAFLIPLISKLHLNNTDRILIIAPTRELAVQIYDECQMFSNNMNITSLLCIGGVSLKQQINGLRNRPNIVIGTPGRLKDLRNQGKLQFAWYNTIVLDEVDRMLDMGFIHDVRFIISQLPQQRQSLFFSATFSPEISGIARTFLRNPVTVSVKSQETSANVDQDIVRTNGRVKFDVLEDLLRQQELEKVLVFGRTKWGIEKLARQLEKRGFAVAALHGNKSQNQRQRALEEFKQNKINILLATDIASRGLDIDNVTHVINYDLPQSYEDYVHRIGRTGRANRKGYALSFVE